MHGLVDTAIVGAAMVAAGVVILVIERITRRS